MNTPERLDALDGKPVHAEGESPVVPLNYSDALVFVDRALTEYFEHSGLPSEGICVSTDQRVAVARNFAPVLALLNDEARAKAVYVSKFVAAVTVGLFDAAVNYLWDETIRNLRAKVAGFDLAYFYDATVDAGRRSSFGTEADLEKLEDWELIRGCRKTGILTDIGFSHLDYIRHMRNYASAAHPNQNDISGLQLIGWLETCIREVLAREPEGPVLEVRRLLENIRSQSLSPGDVAPIVAGVVQLPADLAESLLRTLYGMYCDPQVAGDVKNNIKLLALAVWQAAPIDARREAGIRYGTYRANADVDRGNLAHEFLELVDGLSFLPPDQLTIELDEKIRDLESAHDEFNNFHTESGPARALARQVPDAPGDVPAALVHRYVKIVVRAHIGNGFGISWAAEPHYKKLIDRFQDRELAHVVLLLEDADVVSRLQFESCADRYLALCERLRAAATASLTRAGLDHILGHEAQQLRHLAHERDMRPLLAKLRQFVGGDS